MKHKTLTLPCLRGSIGDWIYYNTIIPFNELERIDTEHQIKENRELDKWLQREISNRVENIKKYLMKEEERFFNSIIVGLYGEIPDWYSLDLSTVAEKFNLEISDNIQKSLGVLTLTGKEILFTIDGQHRIEAIKMALKEDSKKFQNDELSVIFVGHSNDEKGYVRTRKLFATINREAKTPTKNDLAIIDETYAFNIVARMIYAKYLKLIDKIELTPNFDLDRNNHVNFTNLLSITTVCKEFYKIAKYKDDKFKSPTFEDREKIYGIVKSFFDFIFDNIIEYQLYFSEKKTLNQFRNEEKNKPLNLLFLPIGLKLLAKIYSHFHQTGELDLLKDKINLIDFDLYNGHYKFIYFNPVTNRIITSNEVIAKQLTLYLLGRDYGISENELKVSLAKIHNINELSPEFKAFSLPSKL